MTYDARMYCNKHTHTVLERTPVCSRGWYTVSYSHQTGEVEVSSAGREGVLTHFSSDQHGKPGGSAFNSGCLTTVIERPKDDSYLQRPEDFLQAAGGVAESGSK